MEALPPIPATAEARQPALERALQQLRAADPRFDPGAINAELQRRFVLHKQALADRQPDRLAGHVSPPLLERLKQDAAQQLAAGVRTEYRNLRVDGVRPIWLVVGPVRDRYTAALDHTAAVTGVDDASGRPVFGGQESPKVEYWTVSRPTGAQTPDLEAGGSQCPNCGAPADRSHGPVCPYCRAELPSAMLGWILDRVDDEVDWAEVPYQVSPDQQRQQEERRQEDDWLDAQLRGTSF